MTRLVERLLRLSPGEGRRGLLLFAYLFLVVSSLVASKATRDALFLEHYGAGQLPYADIAIALAVGIVISVYLRAGRRVSMPALHVGSLGLLATFSFTFWWLAREDGHSGPLAALIYVWVGVMAALAPAQVWTLANFIVTTRGAKRIFGVIGSGAIAGGIAGGLATRWVVQRVGTENMLVGVASALAISAALVLLIWRDRPVGLAPDSAANGAAVNEGGLRQSLALVWQSPQLRAIAALILIASSVTAIAGWQFKAIAKAEVPETDALAAFFGAFNLYAGLASLVVQLALTAPLLRRFGIGFGLFLVPALLTMGTAGVIVTGGLTAAVLLKASDSVFRYSIDKATLELLFLPVPRADTFRAKSVIDTVVWRGGEGVAGLLILFLAKGLALSPPQVGWFNLALVVLWLAAALAAGRHYMRALSASIHQHRLDAERATAAVLDRTGASIIAAGLTSAETPEVLSALDLLESERGKQLHPAVPALLAHTDHEVRVRAIRLLTYAGDRSVMPAIERLLHDRRLSVRTEALLYVTQHAGIDPLERVEELGDFDDYSIQAGMVAFLARPGPGQNIEAARMILDAMVRSKGETGRRTRLEAARLLQWLPPAFEPELARLLHDDDVEVAREAVIAAGAIGAHTRVLDVIERLRDPLIAPDAVDALAAFGDPVVETLREYLGDGLVAREIRREIPAVMLRVATPDAYSVLVDHLGEPDVRIRFRIITALNKLSQMNASYRANRAAVEAVLTAEITGLYRAYQLKAALEHHGASARRALTTLEEVMANETERVFRLLKVLDPDWDLHSVHVALQSSNLRVHDNALEIMEAALTPQLRGLLVPLLDGAVSDAARLQAARRVTGGTCQTTAELLQTLAVIDDPLLSEAVQETLAAQRPLG